MCKVIEVLNRRAQFYRRAPAGSKKMGAYLGDRTEGYTRSTMRAGITSRITPQNCKQELEKYIELYQ